MRATHLLPADYTLRGTLNLSTPRAALWLNLAAIPLLFFFGWLFRQIIVGIVSPNPFPLGTFSFFTSFSGWKLLYLLLAIIIMLILHELIHGGFFWLFTHDRPRFALKAGYAFAAAPDWYLPRWQYVLVGLSPCVIISTASILLTLVVSTTVIPYLLLVAAFNAAGSLGDLIIVAWVIKQPGDILVKDEGDTFSTYSPLMDA